jgi:methylated-DNA-protein-cysteine methyltransferase-like protein
MSEKNTFERIYEIVCEIPKGKVATYGQIAELIGNKRMSRVVGYALHVNPKPGIIPCHRIVTKDGDVAKAFAFGGENRQIELLKNEGVEFLENGKVDMKKYQWGKRLF